MRRLQVITLTLFVAMMFAIPVSPAFSSDDGIMEMSGSSGIVTTYRPSAERIAIDGMEFRVSSRSKVLNAKGKRIPVSALRKGMEVKFFIEPDPRHRGTPPLLSQLNVLYPAPSE